MKRIALALTLLALVGCEGGPSIPPDPTSPQPSHEEIVASRVSELQAMLTLPEASPGMRSTSTIATDLGAVVQAVSLAQPDAWPDLVFIVQTGPDAYGPEHDRVEAACVVAGVKAELDRFLAFLGWNPIVFARVDPHKLVYLGAFTVPDDNGWKWNGACAYDPSDDGLFVMMNGLGIVKLTIPTPVIAPDNPAGVNRAQYMVAPDGLSLLQLKSRLSFDQFELDDIALVDDWLVVPFAAFYNTGGRDYAGVTVIRSDYTDPRGAWYAGGQGASLPDQGHANRTQRGAAQIPASWASVYLPGARVAAGGHREAGTHGSGSGPNVVAYADAWDTPPGGNLGGTTLLGQTFQGDGVQGNQGCNYTWPGYCADNSYVFDWIEWQGTQAVVFGVNEGSCPTYYDDGPPCAPNKGYHCTTYRPKLQLVDVTHLGEVAEGSRIPQDVLPYVTVDVPDMWKHPDRGADSRCSHGWFGGLAWDGVNGRLFAVQPEAYIGGPLNRHRPAVHVFEVSP